jgi:NTE family protein
MTNALVLGGGGPVGVTWETALLAGLAESGVDLTTADQIVGTSAGSIVGARIALGESPADLLLTGNTAVDGAAGTDASNIDPEVFMAMGIAMWEALSGSKPMTEAIGQLGRMSAEATTIPEEQFVDLIASGVLADAWPDRDYRCTAVDIETGEFTVWSAASGAPLCRAVASSCSVPAIFPPITIDGRRYMDGGVVSGTNATLVEGAEKVVIISVMSRAMPVVGDLLRKGLDEEIAKLEASGAAVEMIEFDDATVEVVAGNLMAFDNTEAVAAVGLAQGRVEAERIGALWG